MFLLPLERCYYVLYSSRIYCILGESVKNHLDPFQPSLLVSFEPRVFEVALI